MNRLKFLPLFFFAAHIQAQTPHSFGLYGGIGISKKFGGLNISNSIGGVKPVEAIGAGLAYQYNKNKFGLALNVGWIQKGFTEKYAGLDDMGNINGPPFTLTFMMEYLQFETLFHFDYCKTGKLKLFTQLGPRYDLHLQNHSQPKTYDENLLYTRNMFGGSFSNGLSYSFQHWRAVFCINFQADFYSRQHLPSFNYQYRNLTVLPQLQIY
jgi:hypothetical protein